MLAIPLEGLLLEERVTQGLRHLELTLPAKVLVVLSPLNIQSDNLLLLVEVGLMIILAPPLPLKDLPLLLLLHDYLLNP